MNAVRLLEFNPKQRYMLRTYVSVSQARYKAGEGGIPSNWRLVDDASEIEELKKIPQFEIRKVEDVNELEKIAQEEMEQAVRMGALPVKAKIENKPKPKRDLSVLQGKSVEDGTEGEEGEVSESEETAVKPSKRLPRSKKKSKK